MSLVRQALLGRVRGRVRVRVSVSVRDRVGVRVRVRVRVCVRVRVRVRVRFHLVRQALRSVGDIERRCPRGEGQLRVVISREGPRRGP